MKTVLIDAGSPLGYEILFGFPIFIIIVIPLIILVIKLIKMARDESTIKPKDQKNNSHDEQNK
ncbi:MAG: hypothetical protein FWC47_08565 [Oscillospiraceae bacterium]|nr:hypothetical protein [Oscillospiraceae bacterium]